MAAAAATTAVVAAAAAAAAVVGAGVGAAAAGGGGGAVAGVGDDGVLQSLVMQNMCARQLGIFDETCSTCDDAFSTCRST